MEIDQKESPSSSKVPPLNATPAFSFSLSIPNSIISHLPSASYSPELNRNGKRPANAPPSQTTTMVSSTTITRIDPICGVEGCGKGRKYRVIQLNSGASGGEQGACGLDHFRVLKGIMAA